MPKNVSIADQQREAAAANNDAAQPGPDQPIAVSDEPDAQAAKEKRVEEAVALWLSTDKFSDPECKRMAKENCDAVLNNQQAIELDEAKRLLNEKANQTVYKKLANHFAARTSLDRKTLIGILALADAWPYRVLREAKKLRGGANGN